MPNVCSSFNSESSDYVKKPEYPTWKSGDEFTIWGFEDVNPQAHEAFSLDEHRAEARGSSLIARLWSSIYGPFPVDDQRTGPSYL